MSFAPKEIIVGASVPLTNGSSVTFSVAGHIETERDCDDAVVIFGRKLLKYTNSASDADRLTVRQVVSSITSTPLAKVPDVGTPAPESVEPVKTPPGYPPKYAPGKAWMGKDDGKVARLDEPAKTSPPTAAEQAAAAVAQIIKPPTAAPKSEASDPYDIMICEGCGAETTRSQAKLSQLFMSKTLCKKCMDSPGGSA